ncbi:hypothetical protein AAG906_022086 [Vitis piasezkii]
MYPFTSLFLIVYCFHLFLLMITLTLCFLAILEIKWSGITLHDWWRNEQFWLIGGTSAHPAAVMQGLLKVLRGGPCECGFKICRECYLDCVGSGGGHCPGCKEPYKECALCWTEVVTGSVTFNSPRGSRGLIQMIEHMNKSCLVPSRLTSTSLEVANSGNLSTCKRLGRAFSDRAILRPFRCLEAFMLSLLRSMHVLIILEDDASFLRYGYLSPDNAVGIRKEVTILRSFGIPDAFLSRIAFNWIDANSWSLVQPQQGATVPL